MNKGIIAIGVLIGVVLIALITKLVIGGDSELNLGKPTSIENEAKDYQKDIQKDEALLRVYAPSDTKPKPSSNFVEIINTEN